MTKDRVNISLEKSTTDLIRRVGNTSRYIEQLFLDARQSWLEALSVVRESGWGRAEVLAACDAFNGHFWQRGDDNGCAISAGLADATELDGLATKWELRPKAWKKKLDELVTDDRLAEALAVVVREFWRHNAELEAQIERL